MQKKQHSTDSSELKLYLIVFATIGLVIVIGTFGICLRSGVTDFLQILPTCVMYFVLCESFCLIVGVCVFYFMRYLNTGAAARTISKIARRRSQQQQQQQAEALYWELLTVFYDVIRKNNHVLKLPISDDAYCLVPKSAHVLWRNGRAFFRFELQINERPSLPVRNVRSCLMRGIHNYYHQFGLVPNVIISDLFFDEQNYILVFELKTVTAAEYHEFLTMKERRTK